MASLKSERELGSVERVAQGRWQHDLMACAPKHMRCSAYALAETVNLAAWSREPEVLRLDPRWPKAFQFVGSHAPFGRLCQVSYEFTSISSDGIIDTGTTYGVRIAFPGYWKALVDTRTKWSSFKHSSGSEGLIAISAWGTTRMWLQEDLQLLNFAPCDTASYDLDLFGWGFPADQIWYNGLESVWKMLLTTKEKQPIVYHLTRPDLSKLEVAVDALINIIIAHVPAADKFTSFWGHTPHGSALPLSDGSIDPDASRQHLMARCRSIMECFDFERTPAFSSSDKSEADPLHVAQCFGRWKSSDIPGLAESHRFIYPLHASPCDQHACWHVGTTVSATGDSSSLNEHPSPLRDCEIGTFLHSVFCDPGDGSINIPKRLKLDINEKPEAERKVWKEGVTLGCLEMIYRIDFFCKEVRMIPDVAGFIRPWEWGTAYIV